MARKMGNLHYSKLPDNVLYDPGLGILEKCVYACLAGMAYRGNLVYTGQRYLATALGIRADRAGKALKLLEEKKHLDIQRGGKGYRGGYRLNHPLFGGDFKDGVYVAVRPRAVIDDDSTDFLIPLPDPVGSHFTSICRVMGKSEGAMFAELVEAKYTQMRGAM